jgi:hypothetical protein
MVSTLGRAAESPYADEHRRRSLDIREKSRLRALDRTRHRRDRRLVEDYLDASNALLDGLRIDDAPLDHFEPPL